MDHKLVEKLEQKLAVAIAEVMLKSERKKLPLEPNDRLLHLMAKAAVTVYEAAVVIEEDLG